MFPDISAVACDAPGFSSSVSVPAKAMGSEPELIGVLVDRAGGVLVWKPAPPGYAQEREVLVDALMHDEPTSFVRLEMRAVSTNVALVSVHLDGGCWRFLEAQGDAQSLCDGIRAIGLAIAADDTLPLVVERSLRTGELLNVWMAFDDDQAERIAGDFTQPGRARCVQALHLPAPKAADCFGGIAVVAGGLVSGTCFHGPYATPEDATRDFEDRDVQWEIVELHNPLRELLPEGNSSRLSCRQPSAATERG